MFCVILFLSRKETELSPQWTKIYKSTNISKDILTVNILDESFNVNDHPFWKSVHDWEPETFKLFQKEITKNTILVDFGTWIGPTILYGANKAKKSYGIEPDPAAFKMVSENVALNPHLNIQMTAGCVSDVDAIVQMKSKRPGNSESSTNKIFHDDGGPLTKWFVQCYTLENYFKMWGIDSETDDIFIKVDVESAECSLLPSWYHWLKGMRRKPRIYISMHPQITKCTDGKVFKLFNYVTRISRNEYFLK